MVWNNAPTSIGCEQAIFIYLVQLRSIIVCYFGFTLEKLAPSEKLPQTITDGQKPNACRAFIPQKLRVGVCDSINQLIIYLCRAHRYAINSLI